MDTIQCAYPEELLGEGKSNAWIIRGSDNAVYIVKFHVEGDRTALNELVCACLAMRFGLPTLKPFLVLLHREHAEVINRKRAMKDLPAIGTGPHFGVKFADSFLTAESLSQKMGRDISARDISNLDSVPDILGFDTMVQNNDRHCNNVGVEPDLLGRQYSYRIFDFDLALFGHKWSTEEVASRYRKLYPIMRFCLVTSEIKSRGDFARFVGTFDASIKEGFDAALDGLPPEWGPDVRADVEGLKAIMAGLDKDSLLAAIVQNKSLQVQL